MPTPTPSLVSDRLAAPRKSVVEVEAAGGEVLSAGLSNLSRVRQLAFAAVIAVGVMLMLGYLFWHSLHLAGMRIYQVDECINIFTARYLATLTAGAEPVHANLFAFVLSWLAGAATSSTELFVSARCVMVLVFWLNILLLAVATGEKLGSRGGLIALAGAATLAPLWDYGFEIRHDNLILTGLLLTWCVVRVSPSGRWSYFIAGMLAAGMQFFAYKALAYALPLMMFLLVFAPPSHNAPRWKLGLAWVGGAAVASLMILFAFSRAGMLDYYLGGLNTVTSAAGADYRFAPWGTLARQLVQTPLLLALLGGGLIAGAVEVLHKEWKAMDWDGYLPELGLVMVAAVALAANPTPFAYNLINFTPFIFLLGFRYAKSLFKSVWIHPSGRPLLVCVVVFAHLVPFAIATNRHEDFTNFRQEGLMRLSERLTDPNQDPVFDGIGMVPMRQCISTRSFLHSMNIKSFSDGSGPRLQDFLSERPAAVLIPSYRTDWLPEEDHEFIRGRYVPVADDFWVLGTRLPAGGGSFEVVHPGRYRIASVEGSDLAGTYPDGLDAIRTPLMEGRIEGMLNGQPLTDQVVELEVGTHHIECGSETQPTVVWVGPELDRVGRLAQSSHRRLFVNWY